MTAVEFAEMVLNFAHPCIICCRIAKPHQIFSDGAVTCSKSCTEVRVDQIRENGNMCQMCNAEVLAKMKTKEAKSFRSHFRNVFEIK